MKKLLSIMAIGLAALTANAGPGVFNHLGFGAGIGAQAEFPVHGFFEKC